MVRLLLTFLIGLVGFIFISWYRGFSLKSFSFEIANTEIGLYNLSFKRNQLKIDTLTLDIKVRDVPVYERSEISSSTLWQLIEWIVKVFSLFPFEVSVKNLYLKVGNQTVNAYSVSLLKNHLSFDFIEVLNSNGETLLNLAKGKVYGNLPTYYGSVLFKTKSFSGIIGLKLETLKRELAINLTNKEINANGLIKFTKEKIKISSYGKHQFVNFALRGFLFKNRLNLNGFLISKAPIKGSIYLNLKGSLDNLTANFYGAIYLCQNTTLYLDGIYTNNGIYLSFVEPKNQLYFGGFLNISHLKGILLLTSPANGFAQLKLNNTKLKFLVEKFGVKNICGVSIKNLATNGVVSDKEITVKGQFENLTYQQISLETQKFSIFKTDSKILAELKGSLNGLLAKKKTEFWGFLNGKIKVKEESLYVNLPLLEGSILKNQRVVRSYLNFLSYKDVSIKDIKILLKDNEEKTTISFSNSWKGFLQFLKEEKSAKAKIKAIVWYKNRPFNLKSNLKLSPKKGLITVKFPEGIFLTKYRRINELVKGSCNVVWKSSSINGTFSVKNETVTFKGLVNANFADRLLFFSAPFEGKFSFGKTQFAFKTLPFCLYYSGINLTCIKDLNLKGNKKEFGWFVKSSKNSSLISVDLKGSLKGEKLNLFSNIEVKTKLLNLFLENFNTLIVEPNKFNLSFTYRGSLKELPKKVFWNYSQTFTVYSMYFYKPLRVYTSFFIDKGTLSGFVGLADLTTATPYGTVQISYPFKGNPKISFDLNSLPFQLFYRDVVDSYLNVDLYGNATLKKVPQVNLKVALNGFVKVNKYSLPKMEESENKNKGSKPIYNVKIISRGLIYLRTPSGTLILTLKGTLKNKKTGLTVLINYGKLNLLGKTFYVNSGKVILQDDKIYLNLPLTHYATDRTVYLKIYGYLPWQNLKLDIYSIPPASREELLMQLVSGGGESLSSVANISPLSQLLLKTFVFSIAGLVKSLASQLVGNVDISFTPYFEPTEGLVLGVSVKKFFGDYATIGYHWVPSVNPKATYFWGSVRFLYNSFLRFVKYSDGSISTNIRFMKNWGLPH